MRILNGKNLLFLVVVLTFIFISPKEGPVANMSGRVIAGRVLDNTAPQTAEMNMKMVLISSRGIRRERELVLLTKDFGEGQRRYFMQFRAPSDIEGTGLLIYSYRDRADDQWLYLPALGRVRRISTGRQDRSFVGSDLSYADMSMIYREVERDVHTLTGTEKINGTECYILESKPVDPDYQYGKYIRWIRKDNYVPVKTKAYDQSGELEKVIVSEEISEIDDLWSVGKMIVEDVNKGSKTILETDSNYNIEIPDEIFTQIYLTQ